MGFSPRSRASGERPCVLIVDDNDDIREMLCFLLEAEGYHAAAASDGNEALAWLTGRSPPFLVLLDLMMPGMNGWDLLAHLRAEAALAAMPVVVMSAADRPVVPLATRVLQKPLDVETVLALVRAHCDSRAPLSHRPVPDSVRRARERSPESSRRDPNEGNDEGGIGGPPSQRSPRCASSRQAPSFAANTST